MKFGIYYLAKGQKLFMKGDHQVIAAVVIFFIGTIFGYLISDKPVAFSINDHIPALTTLFAAFLGAKYAFKLNSNKEKRDIQNRNIVAGNLAVFNMVRMLNILLNYQNQIIEPVRGKKLAFIEMPPTLHLIEDDVNMDFNSLSFLLDYDNPNILGELSIEKSKFKKAIDAINQRSQLHISRLQPILEQANLIEGGNYSPSYLKEILGPQLYATMSQSTNQIIEHVDSTIPSMQEICKKLSDALKKIFPNEKIISLSIQNA